jgi:hypothetical protein
MTFVAEALYVCRSTIEGIQAIWWIEGILTEPIHDRTESSVVSSVSTPEKAGSIGVKAGHVTSSANREEAAHNINNAREGNY